jgi:YggT family protein
VSPGGYAPGLRLLGQLCEPVLKPVRRVIPPIGQIDFSVLWVSIAIGALLVLLR